MGYSETQIYYDWLKISPLFSFLLAQLINFVIQSFKLILPENLPCARYHAIDKIDRFLELTDYNVPGERNFKQINLNVHSVIENTMYTNNLRMGNRFFMASKEKLF